MPHPAERKQKPVYSQDRYKRDPNPAPAPDEAEPPARPVYSQDKYQRLETPDDYSGELRKVPEKGREWSEIEIAKGVVKLNALKYDEAVAHFEKALEKDPRNFVALEYIGSTQERRGDLKTAVAYLAKAKHLAPKGRWGQINFQIGRLYLTLKNYERAEIYLKLARDQGGQLTAVNYLLGYLLYLEERYFEAEYYLHEARMRAIRRTALPPERQMLQAINYYLGELYARLGFVQYAVTTLRETEVGDSWEVRQGAWRVHSEFNRMSYYLTLGSFGQFDSNVVLVPSGGSLPVDFSSQAGMGTVLTTNGGWQTSPARKWVFGIDSALYLNDHLNQTLVAFDVFDVAFDAWVNYWNRKDWSLVARFDFNDAFTDRRKFTRFQTATAFTISGNYLPFQRWNWETGFQYRINNFATDLPSGPDRRSGHTYVGYLRASLKAPNPRLRPTLGYTFEADETEGDNFQARNHIFLAEASWRLFSRTHLVGGLQLTKSAYPSHINGRDDSTLQAKLGFNHIFTPHWTGILDITQLEDTSTLVDFSYKRLIVTGGVTYTF